MIRMTLFAAALLSGTACSANSDSSAGNIAAPPANTGEYTPPPPVAMDEVPKNAPAATFSNVPATDGRANMAATKPPATVTPIGKFDAPFAMAFLPDGALLVTEKAGMLKLRRADGQVADVSGVPPVAQGGQGGLLDVAIAPDFATSRQVYLSFAKPGGNGSELALVRGTLDAAGTALADVTELWRSGSAGPGGQFGANIAFAPDGQSIFLSSGERQRFTPAQDPDQALGKIIHMTLDGKPAPDNPDLAAGGVRPFTWSSGHRNPYGLLFTPDGRLWSEEMGPSGGDELNLIERGKNYGWPLVSNGQNYSGQAIPDHPSAPQFQAPVLWWNPVISPGGMIHYSGKMFPALNGSLLIAGLSSKAIIQVKPDGTTARPVAWWSMGERIRDLAQAPDGSIWALEDGGRGSSGRLLRLTP